MALLECTDRNFADFIISVPRELNPVQAVEHLIATIPEDWPHIEFSPFGRRDGHGFVCIRHHEISEIRHQPDFSPARYFMKKICGHSSLYALPHRTDTKALEAIYPFHSATLTKFLTEPLGNRDEAAVKPVLETLQREYTHYLCQTLHKIRQDDHMAALDLWFVLFERDVLEMTDNARLNFGHSLKNQALDDLLNCGRLTPHLKQTIIDAGGPSTYNKPYPKPRQP